MSDLADDVIESRCRMGVTAAEIDMAMEIKRRRAEEKAGREHIYDVTLDVAEEIVGSDEWQATYHIVREIARRVASRLSVPVLSEENVLTIHSFLSRHHDMDETDLIALLRRLIAAVMP